MGQGKSSGDGLYGSDRVYGSAEDVPCSLANMWKGWGRQQVLHKLKKMHGGVVLSGKGVLHGPPVVGGRR